MGYSWLYSSFSYDCSALFAGVAPSLFAGFEEVSGHVREPRVAKSYRWPQGAEGGLQPTASKKPNPSVLQLQETELPVA